MILTEINSNEEDFYEVGNVIEGIAWLNEPSCAKGLHSLWEEYGNEAYRDVLKILLTRFTYHFDKDRHDAVDKVIEFIHSKGASPENSLIIGTATGKDSDGASYGLYLFKQPLANENTGWSERNIIPVFSFACKRCNDESVSNIFLFDDFIGSGNTLVKNITSLKSALNKRKSKFNLYVISFVGMEFGIRNINNSTNVEVYCSLGLKKGISEYKSPDNDAMIKSVLEMEGELGGKWRGHDIKTFSLGYKKSEALYAAYRANCSNNVFPIFWWPQGKSGKYRITLFNRL